MLSPCSVKCFTQEFGFTAPCNSPPWNPLHFVVKVQTLSQNFGSTTSNESGQWETDIISVARIKLHMTREKLLRVRLSDEEYRRLKDYANETNRQVSEVIRDYIKRLPKSC